MLSYVSNKADLGIESVENFRASHRDPITSQDSRTDKPRCITVCLCTQVKLGYVPIT
jgi:hypothetical protein